MEKDTSFISELSELLNKHSQDAKASTPDHILAGLLGGVLIEFGFAVNERDRLAGRSAGPEVVSKTNSNTQSEKSATTFTGGRFKQELQRQWNAESEEKGNMLKKLSALCDELMEYASVLGPQQYSDFLSLMLQMYKLKAKQ